MAHWNQHLKHLYLLSALPPLRLHKQRTTLKCKLLYLKGDSCTNLYPVEDVT